jgi:hypothetical protein
MQQFQVSQGAGALLAIVGGLFGIAVSIFWMWVGWRAMRAHERIADTLQDTGNASQPTSSTAP